MTNYDEPTTLILYSKDSKNNIQSFYSVISPANSDEDIIEGIDAYMNKHFYPIVQTWNINLSQRNVTFRFKTFEEETKFYWHAMLQSWTVKIKKKKKTING